MAYIQKTMESFLFSDTIYFNFSQEHQVCLNDLIDHLEGLQYLSKKVPLTLKKIYAINGINDFNVRLIDVNVDGVKHGSLEDLLKFAFEFVFSEKDREKIQKMSSGLKISWILALLAIGYAFKSCSPASNMKNINGIQRPFIINIAGKVNMSCDKLQPVVEEVVNTSTKKDQVSATKFMRPAKRYGGDIIVGDREGASIPHDFISKLPLFVDDSPNGEHTKLLQNTEIFLRALDIDSTERGWAAIIPAVLPDSRIKLEISPDIDKTRLTAKLNLRGDVQIHYKLQDNNELKPTKALLLDICE